MTTAYQSVLNNIEVRTGMCEIVSEINRLSAPFLQDVVPEVKKVPVKAKMVFSEEGKSKSKTVKPTKMFTQKFTRNKSSVLDRLSISRR